MLYSKQALSVRHAASRDDCRANLCGVRFNADGSTEATDGHIFCKATTEHAPDADFPTVPGAGELTGDLEPFTMPRDAVDRLVKALPKKTPFPILANAALEVPHTNRNGSVRFHVTDLEAAQTVDARKVEGEWPNTAYIMPDKDGRTPQVRISLNLSLLSRIEKAIREFRGGDAVATLEVFDPLSPVKITAENPDVGEFLALIMPMRI